MTWHTITESKFGWEREALDFIQARYPNDDRHFAWSNFEFIADDGSINEVDLLVFTPQGLFLIEIKSREGRLSGDAGTWTWERDGGRTTTDNPLILANLKAKRLKSLLQRQRVFQKKAPPPFIEALVFCSAPGLQVELQDAARFRVSVRDREATPEKPARPGIMAAVLWRNCPGLEPAPRVPHDRPLARMVSQALEQAGVRPSQRTRRVGDFVLDQVVDTGPGYQDWAAKHAQLGHERRIRIYQVRHGATADERKAIERAAQREATLLEWLRHPGIVAAHGYTEHELGPAIIYEHDPRSMRLDHFLAERGGALTTTGRLDIVRQIADALRFAHEKKIVHRTLSPRSVLVTPSADGRPLIKILNWHLGCREATDSTSVSREVTATAHVDRLVEDASTAYMAPEVLSDPGNTGEHLDVFSLGAVAYHVFSGAPPAANALELSAKLRVSKGLQISSVLNAAGEALQYLIQYSTHPEVATRVDSVDQFLEDLHAVEDELTSSETHDSKSPDEATAGDTLGGLLVKRRLGQGATSIALLVERDGEAFVAKIANDPEQNERIAEEADVLSKLRHAKIVEFCDKLEICDRSAFLMRPIFAEKEKGSIETLRARLRREGHLHVDLLQRFGEDLLEILHFLEDQGVAHRDIKPDNLAVGMVGRGDRLHLVLFDFSLSRTPVRNIAAGTPGYLDPMLQLRKGWDTHAERYAAAITLYEMAVGQLPRWGDGKSDPSHLQEEITIESELFDGVVRDRLPAFFRKAFKRDIQHRFDNAEEMLKAWRQAFEGIAQSEAPTDHEDEEELRRLLADATWDSTIHELRLGTRATNALDRNNIQTVEGLLSTPLRRLLRLRGVGNKTRREITAAVRILRDRLGKPSRKEGAVAEELKEVEAPKEVAELGIDVIARRLLPRKSSAGAGHLILESVLGLATDGRHAWASQAKVADDAGVTRARVGQVIATSAQRWSKDPAIAALRMTIDEILKGTGGVMAMQELLEALLATRGCALDEPDRTKVANAVLRAAIEVEKTLASPAFLLRRDGTRLLVAKSVEMADYALRLGQAADRLAREEPVPPPERVAEVLRKVRGVPGLQLGDARLLKLAALSSEGAVVSSRQELYPRGMSALRALKLSQGAVLGVPSLAPEALKDRVRSRYPDAEPLPDPPALDRVLKEAGFDLTWDPETRAYISQYRSALSISSGSDSLIRQSTAVGKLAVDEVTPEVADARQLEQRLQRAIKEASFLVLLTRASVYERAARELERLGIDRIHLEMRFLEALREQSDRAKVSWDVVVSTDASPGSRDWPKLLLLVERAVKTLEEQLSQARRPILLTYAGFLGRYDQLDMLERLRERTGKSGGPPGLWLLVPNDREVQLEGKGVPLLSPGQRIRLPESWLSNIHRSGNGGESRP